MQINGVGAEQPGRADPGKNVKIGHAEHHFWPAVDDGRPCLRRFPQRERERLAGRLAGACRDLVAIGLPHPPRDRADMRRPRLDDLDPTFQW